MKGKRTDLGEAGCGIARALGTVGDWWSLLIVREAFHGKQRFGEFEQSLGIARNILSKRLKKLVDEGIFRVDDRDGRSHSYILTEKGADLYVVLVALWQWGEEYCFAEGHPNHVMVDQGGSALPKMTPLSSSGRSIGARDFRLVARDSAAPAAADRSAVTGAR